MLQLQIFFPELKSENDTEEQNIVQILNLINFQQVQTSDSLIKVSKTEDQRPLYYEPYVVKYSLFWFEHKLLHLFI